MTTTTDPYTPARAIMTAAELAEARIERHGRDYTRSDDGYEDMEVARTEGWRSRPSWGRDGWDLGAWPYVSIQTREVDGRFQLQQICEGDHDLYEFATEGERDAAIDYLFLWYAANESWAPLTGAQRELLDRGELDIDVRFRGPYRQVPA